MISNSKINWAVIPCAGLGTRLLPVTKTVPKAMIPVANYPIIHFAVKEAKRNQYRQKEIIYIFSFTPHY